MKESDIAAKKEKYNKLSIEQLNKKMKNHKEYTDILAKDMRHGKYGTDTNSESYKRAENKKQRYEQKIYIIDDVIKEKN